MSAPGKTLPDLGPRSVVCPKCNAPRGYPCSPVNRLGFVCIDKTTRPHALRVFAATRWRRAAGGGR